jgi:hypothetical protein
LTATGTSDIYDVSREEGLIVEAGDALNAANLNDLEDRIDAGFDDTIPADALGEPEGPAALDSGGKVEADQASAKIISVTGNKTLALTDAGTMQYVNSASAITVTIPTNASAAFPVGTEIEIYRVGSGTVTLGVTSLTIQCWVAGRTVADRYTSVVIKKLATDTWSIQGNVG